MNYLIVFLVMIGLIVPNFLMANFVQLGFGVYLGWLPVRGTGTIWHLVLPVIILSLPLDPPPVPVTGTGAEIEVIVEPVPVT